MAGLYVGFYLGAQTVIDWGVEHIQNFVDIDVDEAKILRGIWMYRNQVGCLGKQNASILYDTGD